MLNNLSKLSYKFSTNAIFIFYSIIGDLLLNQESFGKFSTIMAIEILIFNISDFFNIRYLLGKFSTDQKNLFLKKIFKFKLTLGIFSIILLSPIFLIYKIPWYYIIILITINYIQMLTSTIATYVFSNAKDFKLLFSNTVGGLMGIIYIMLDYYIYKNITILTLLISMLFYRIGEMIVLYKKELIVLNVNYKYSYNDFKEAFPFYIQLVISMGSAKLFMLFLPSLVTYTEISIIATYEYILAIPLFLISVLTMSTYTQLYQDKLDINFKKYHYDTILSNYYKKAMIISIVSMFVQLIYILYIKSMLITYLPYLFIQDITIVFSAIQGFLLFFWKLHKSYIIITIILFTVKNTIMLYLINIYGIVGYFWIAVFLEISILLYIQYIIYIKKQNLTK